MEQPQVLNTLVTKRRDIEAYIGSLERSLEQVRCDLSAVLATIKVLSGDGPMPKAYMNLSKVFPRNELPKLVLEQMGGSSPPRHGILPLPSSRPRGWTKATATYERRWPTR